MNVTNAYCLIRRKPKRRKIYRGTALSFTEIIIFQNMWFTLRHMMKQIFAKVFALLGCYAGQAFTDSLSSEDGADRTS
jgi:hypothetical protein